MSCWLLLRDEDNVVVLTRQQQPGAELHGPQGQVWPVPAALAAGHKLAVKPIAAGDLVIKNGFPIGVATAAIAPGEHVHTHNLRSRYIAIGSKES